MGAPDRRPMVGRVISGGQTGADRAALDVAVALELPYGGRCPGGGWAEDLPEPPGLLDRYPALLEVPFAEPAERTERTEWNVRDSDATLVLFLSDLGRSPGSELTVTTARRLGRPHLVARVDEVDRIEDWLESLGPVTLNVAGPRESEDPGLYDAAVPTLRSVLNDAALEHRADALQVEAQTVVERLELVALLSPLGPVRFAGSFVSGLMCWRDLDVMVLGGPAISQADVLALMARVVKVPGVVAFDYRDETGPRSPTGVKRDERFHVPFVVETPPRPWQVDLSIWLYDDHANVTAWHQELAASLRDDQRRAILRIKDAWCRHPEYPDVVKSTDIYTAVLEHGVRQPGEFEVWVAAQSSE